MSEGQLPGIYRVDVLVNEHSVEQRDVRFIRASGTSDRSSTGLFPCLDTDFFRSQGVADTALQNRSDADATCIAFDQGLAGMVYDYDFNRQVLSIEIPQAYLGSIPFEVRRRQWSDGEQVAFTNYSFSGSTVESDTGSRQDQFGSLRSGINAGGLAAAQFLHLAERHRRHRALGVDGNLRSAQHGQHDGDCHRGRLHHRR